MNTTLFAFVSLGPTEMIVVGLVALLLFGSRLPSAMRSVGQGISEFKRGLADSSQEEGSQA